MLKPVSYDSLQEFLTLWLVLFHYNKKIKLINMYNIFIQRTFSTLYN